MSLKVFAGQNQAARRYELEFFRAFAATLSAQFESEGWDGVLLGHPLSKDNKYFQPDALLITSHTVIIIDFKNFDDCKVQLPDESQFATAEWKSMQENRQTVVKGGSSANPFTQLRKQSNWLREILTELGLDVAIQSCVLFQGDVEVIGVIPGQFQAFFSIATKFDYTKVLNDSINIKSRTTIQDFDSIVSRFEVREFKDFPTIDPRALTVVATMAEASRQKQQAAQVEALAEEKRVRAERLFEVAKKEGDNLLEAKSALTAAAAAAEKAKQDADAIRLSFDSKRHELESQRAKTKRAIAVLVTIALLIAAAVVIFTLVVQDQARIAADLEEDYAAGRVCMPAATAVQFVGDKRDVCVTFTVHHINKAGKNLIMKEQNWGDFQVFVRSKAGLSETEAARMYMGKTIEVRGKVVEYEGTPEIEVYSTSKIVAIP